MTALLVAASVQTDETVKKLAVASVAFVKVDAMAEVLVKRRLADNPDEAVLPLNNHPATPVLRDPATVETAPPLESMQMA